MSASQEMVREWFDEGVRQGAGHMLVIYDAHDYTNYPKYVMPLEDVQMAYKEIHGYRMRSVVEVYNLSFDREEQLAEERALHF